MKNNLCSFALVLMWITTSHAQPLSATLQRNNVKAVVQSNGALFQNDLAQGQFIVPYQTGQPEISALRAAGLWLGGINPNGELRLSVQLYNENGKTDFVPGLHPMHESSPPALNKIWRVTREQIEAHLADFADNGVVDNPIPEIWGWPTNDNHNFTTYNPGLVLPLSPIYLADYWDGNGTGTYDPEIGELPSVGIRGCFAAPLVPDEMLWFTFHDVIPHTQSEGVGVNVEIQATVFVYGCQESNHPLNNTMIVSYKLIYWGTESLQDAYLGWFNDIEIGNAFDDFVGSDLGRKLLYAYNGDDNDEGFYGTNPPVIGITLLREPLDETVTPLPLHAIFPFDYSTNDPVLAVDYYNLLRGQSIDGSLIPNNGFPYPDDPNNPNGLSEVTAGNTPGDRRMMASYGPFTLEPGAVNEMIVAYSFVQQEGATPLENLTALYAQSDALRNYFNGCFAEATTACSPLVSADDQPHVFTAEMKVMPNPASEEVWVQFSDTQVQRLQLYDVTGKKVLELANEAGALTWAVPIRQLSAGMYWIKALGDNGSFAAKPLVVAR